MPVGRDAGRQGRAGLGPSAGAGRDRRHRHQRRQPRGGRGRPGDRHRHAAAGLHHRLAGAVRTARGAAGADQRRRVRCGQARRAGGGRRRGRGAGGADCAARRLARAGGLGEGRARMASTAWNRDWDAVTAAAGRQRPALRRAGDRRGLAPGRRATRWWSARPAACRASCTSSGGRSAPGGYHLEYGFSCMGYEIAGGLGREDGRAGARRDRHGRRRQLPDAELRDRHLGDAGAEADHRGARQPRLRLHQPAAADRSAARRSTTCSPTRARDAARDRLRRPCRQPRRALGEGGRHRRAGGGHGPRRGRPTAPT